MSLGMEFNSTFLMLHEIIVEKLVQEKYLSFVYNKTGKKKGGSQILDWTYAKGGGGVIKMRTACNRGGVGV